jgi:hypothetical protein
LTARTETCCKMEINFSPMYNKSRCWGSVAVPHISRNPSYFCSVHLGMQTPVLISSLESL